MLDERRPERVTYDAHTDTLDVDLTAEPVSVGGSGPRGGVRSVKASLLLDAKGFLAGIDLRDEAHIVVMLGPHEAVAKQVSARVEVLGGSEITRVRIARAKGQVRGAEKNPYV